MWHTSCLNRKQATFVFYVLSFITSLCGSSAPLQVFSSFSRDDTDHRICYDTTSPEHFEKFLVYSSLVSIVLFAVPFVVVMVCYGLMVHTLLERSWAPEGDRGNVTAQRSKQKSVKMIIIVLAAFMLCFLPFHITRSLYYYFRHLRKVSPAQVRNAQLF